MSSSSAPGSAARRAPTNWQGRGFHVILARPLRRRPRWPRAGRWPGSVSRADTRRNCRWPSRGRDLGRLAEELDGETRYRRDGNLRLARTPTKCPSSQPRRTARRRTGPHAARRPSRYPRRRARHRRDRVSSPPIARATAAPIPARRSMSFVRAAERLGVRHGSASACSGSRPSNGRVTGVDTDNGTIPPGHVVIAPASSATNC